MYPSKDAQPIVTLSMPSLRADQKSPLSLEVPHPVPWRRQSIAPVIPIMRGHTEKRQPHWLCKCLASQKIHAAGRFIPRMRLTVARGPRGSERGVPVLIVCCRGGAFYLMEAN